MNVALIHFSYPPIVGGVEFVIQGQARAFARNGHRVRVICGNNAPAERNIRCVGLPAMRARPWIAGDFPAARRHLTQKLRRLVRGLDLVVVHNVMSMHFNLALTAALWDLAIEGAKTTRWIFWTHDLALLNPDYARTDTRRLPFSLLKQRHPSARYVAVSELRRRELCKLLKMPPARVRVVPDGIDVPGLLDLDPGVWNFFLKEKLHTQDHVLFLPTRILPRKNLEAAVAVAAALKKQRKKVKLLITGAPDPHNPSTVRYFRQIQAQVRKLGMRNEVIFLNSRFPVGFRELLSVYRLCDAVLMSSRQEGFGLPLLEGGVQSKPLICPRRPPFTEVMGGNAIFLDENNPSASARRIARRLDSSPTTAHFKRVLSVYSWEAIWTTHLRQLAG